MRHKIVHDYLAVDEDVVWQVVSSDLPQLARHLGHLAEEEDGRSPA